MDKALTAAGSSNCQHFFYISLTTMATDMNKGVPSLGHKFFLQYLAHKDPKIVVADLSKYTVIKNSYMNRQNIGLSILWVLGQAGVKDFHMGLQGNNTKIFIVALVNFFRLACILTEINYIN